MKVIAALVLVQGVILRKDAPHVLAKTEKAEKVEKVAAQVNMSKFNMSKVEYPCGDSAKVAKGLSGRRLTRSKLLAKRPHSGGHWPGKKLNNVEEDSRKTSTF